MPTPRPFPDAAAVARAAAEVIVDAVTRRPDAVLCLAAGSTPTAAYQMLRGHAAAFAAARVVQLDEWGGLPAIHPSTCDAYLRQHVLAPLNIPDDRYTRFHADSTNPHADAARVRRALDRLGGIDLCVLGLGLNGHLGFNEPHDHLLPHAHVAALTPTTLAHPMVATIPTKPTHGLTLGMREILASRRILLLVTGAAKQPGLERLLEPRVDTHFPASLLWLHGNVTLFVDEAALTSSP